MESSKNGNQLIESSKKELIESSKKELIIEKNSDNGVIQIKKSNNSIVVIVHDLAPRTCVNQHIPIKNGTYLGKKPTILGHLE